MKIKKMKVNGYDLFIYNTKKYSSIQLKFLFEMPFTRDNMFMCDVLEEYMIHTTKHYKTRKELGDRIMELYSVSFGISNVCRGEKMFTEVNFGFYDPELVQDDYMREVLEFAGEVLFQPNFSGGKLDKAELERSKTNLANSLGDSLMSPQGREKRSFIRTLYPDTYKTATMVESKEEYESIINSYSDSDLIGMHKKLFRSSLVGAVLMGNIKDEYIKYIEDIFKFDKVVPLDKKFKEKLKVSTKTDFFTHVKDPEAHDSVLKVVYECPAKNFKERRVYSAISRMLGGSGMLVHKVLRDEMGIVYSAGANYSSLDGCITLSDALDSTSKDKAIEGFEEAIKRLDKKTIDVLLRKIKEENEEDLYAFDENKWNLFDELCDRAFKLNATYRKVVKVMATVTRDDVINALEKMKVVKIHFYEGVKK